jgi:hypothetical protein
MPVSFGVLEQCRREYILETRILGRSTVGRLCYSNREHDAQIDNSPP